MTIINVNGPLALSSARRRESSTSLVIDKRELEGILKNVLSRVGKNEVTAALKAQSVQPSLKKSATFAERVQTLVARGRPHEIAHFAATEVRTKNEASALLGAIERAQPPTLNGVLEQADSRLWGKLSERLVPLLPLECQATAVRAGIKSGGVAYLAPLAQAAKAANGPELERLIQSALDAGATPAAIRELFAINQLHGASRIAKTYLDRRHLPSREEIFRGGNISRQCRYLALLSELGPAERLQEMHAIAGLLPKDGGRSVIDALAPAKMRAELIGAWHLQQGKSMPIEELLASYSRMLRSAEHDSFYGDAAASAFVHEVRTRSLYDDLLSHLSREATKFEGAAKHLLVEAARADDAIRVYLEEQAAIRAHMTMDAFLELEEAQRSKSLHALTLLKDVRQR